MSKGELIGATQIKDSYGPADRGFAGINPDLQSMFYPGRFEVMRRLDQHEAARLFESPPQTPQAIVDRVMLEGLSLAVAFPVLLFMPRTFDTYTVRRYFELMCGHIVRPDDHILLMGSGETVPEVVGHTIVPPNGSVIDNLYRKRTPKNGFGATPEYVPGVRFLAVDPYLPDRVSLNQQFDLYNFPHRAVVTKSESLADMIKHDSFGREKFDQIWMHQAEPLAFSSAIASLNSESTPARRGTIFGTQSKGGAANKLDEAKQAQRAQITNAATNVRRVIDNFNKRLKPRGLIGLTVGNGNDRAEYHQRIALMELLKASLVGTSRLTTGLTTKRLCFNKESTNDPDAMNPDAMNPDEIRLFTDGNIDDVVGYMVAEKSKFARIFCSR